MNQGSEIYGLDAVVGLVADPAHDPSGPGQARARVAEEHALDPSPYHDVTADRHRYRLAVT